MAENATILIPDISGFTEFTTVTEIDHASHIISELLELIVASNSMGFTVAEIEGDAVLFYLKGETPSLPDLVDQCIRMFQNFHSRLMVIERDTVCQCGACQTATNLSIKFIAHFGEIKEIQVANFVKVTGVNMIIAHRLLKNSIDSDEYILFTKQCMDSGGKAHPTQSLNWIASKQEYQAIGEVQFEYALLSDQRKQIPRPAKRDAFVLTKGDDRLELEVEKPMFEVYQTLIDVDQRKDWMNGVDSIDRDPVTERIGMQHNCQFMGMTMVNTCLHNEVVETGATYVERVEVPALSLDTVDTYELTSKNSNATQLVFTIDWGDTLLPDEQKQNILMGIKSNLELFKTYLENKKA